jgi:mono/diheme cytochrome c family protein
MKHEKRILVTVAAALLLLPMAPCHAEKGPPPPQGPAAQYDGASGAPFDLSDPARIASGKSRFNSTCAQYCHGDKPPLFIDRTDLEAEYVFNTIRDGGKGATPMPPWGDIFTAEEVWELVAYVKSLGKW